MMLRSTVMLSLCAASCWVQAGEVVWLDHFNKASVEVPAPWRVVQLNSKVPPTRYRIVRWDDVPAIEATAERSMALLARPAEINLSRTPVLCWRWRVDAPLVKANMASKSSDDYAARVYVSFALPASELGFLTRAKLKLARSIYGDVVPDAVISYVWDNRHPVGMHKPNVSTDRMCMNVAESGGANAGKWVIARHDVLRDVVAEFGSGQARLIQLAVAADTDNTGEFAHAGFSGFHFADRATACFAG